MHVGVLGGGLQGCCVAIALADRGARVTLFDKGQTLLSGAAVANEGKIHLGYTYAGDGGLATARTMIKGALSFAPFMERHLGLPPDRFDLSSPYVYVVHRDSQRTVGEISAYFSGVHAVLTDSAMPDGRAYFGRDFRSSPRRWSSAECEAAFDPAFALAAFETQEIAIEPTSLARAVRDRLQSHSQIEVCLGRSVQAVKDEGSKLRVVTACAEATCLDSFDYVVNALWDGRLAVDATLGVLPHRSWVYRFKYGITFRSSVLPPLTATVVLGPFGDVVSYGSGITYLSWYPTCLDGITLGTNPPARAGNGKPMSDLLTGSLKGLGDVILALRDIDPADVSDLAAKGGTIVARGRSDIDDLRSELHERSRIGVISHGRYHSIDAGKMTMAPVFAEVCADRIFS
jgi:glycine/D-amino acid oxidase-like deaminating enzyme